MDGNQKDISDTKAKEEAVSIHTAFLFNNDPFLHFAYKKSDRIAAAFYLVTNSLSDNEPMKRELRQESICLISEILSLTTGSPLVRSGNLNSSLSHIFKLISLLDIARVSGLLSEMNYHILKSEMENLLHTIQMIGIKHQGKEPMLKSEFFAVPREKISREGITEGSNFEDTSQTREEFFASRNINLGINQERKSVKDNIYKGHNNVKDSVLNDAQGKRQLSSMPATSTDKASGLFSEIGPREKVVIGMLKLRSGLSIKDFSKSIKGCSEKTIQRMLLKLVSIDVLKKEGERRWTKYSLVG